MKVDRGIPSRLHDVPEAAAAVERQGYDGCWTGEINHDPFLPLLLAAEHTSRLEIGTSIAVAFARNPMIVANLGWDLQDYSRGRFILGLGTQIAPHIEKRFSMPWSHPVRRMREFIAALRAIWTSWQDGTRLSFEGEFYTHTLMTPMFTPEPSPYPAPKVFVSAVGEKMTELCGEAADGVLVHAFTTKRYLDEVTLPALTRGVRACGPEARRCRGVGPGVRRHRRYRVSRSRPRPSRPASRSRSTDRRRPTAACWNSTAGVTWRPNCTGCPGGASGTPWAR